jgi:glycosyltransferase involved in cell wall biosynthesis
MRIVQVVHQFLPRHLAGTEVYTYSLARELSRRHQVWVYTREDGFFSEELQEEDAAYDGLPIRRVYFNLQGLEANLLNQSLIRFRNPVIERSFARFLEETQPDVMHFQHLFKLSAALIRVAKSWGVPVVVTLADFWFICHNAQLLRPSLARCSGPGGGLKCPACAELNISPAVRALLWPALAPLFVYRNAYLKRCLEQADVVISPSAFVKQKLVENGYRAERIQVSDYGLSTNIRQDYHPMPSSRVRFGYIGTLTRHKGVHVLIEAFNHLDSAAAELLIYGNPTYDPAYSAQLQALAQHPGIRFLGEIDNTTVGRALSGLDVLVVPSIWYENSPINIHEANLAGIPVIASNIGGMAELVPDGVAGLQFQVGDAGDLAAKMRRFIEDRSLVEQFRGRMPPVKSIAENAQELEAIYERLVAAGHG